MRFQLSMCHPVGRPRKLDSPDLAINGGESHGVGFDSPHNGRSNGIPHRHNPTINQRTPAVTRNENAAHDRIRLADLGWPRHSGCRAARRLRTAVLEAEDEAEARAFRLG